MASGRDLDQDLDIAVAAVQQAGARVLELFRTGLDVRYKNPDQPVTDADVAADRLLRDALLGGRPEYGWLSEESAASADRRSRSRTWIVDPIDGTNSFIAGLPEFAVSVGLVENGAPVVAALLNPATDELYHAVRGGGAFRNGEPIEVADAPPLGTRPLMLASRNDIRSGYLAAYQSEWTVQGLGSTAYRMLKVADGTAHAYFARSRKSEWDVCGATLVVTEAGGRVTQLDGSPISFNQPDPAFEGILALGRVELIF